MANYNQPSGSTCSILYTGRFLVLVPKAIGICCIMLSVLELVSLNDKDVAKVQHAEGPQELKGFSLDNYQEASLVSLVELQCSLP